MSEGEGKIGRVCHVGKASSILVQRWLNFFAERGWDVDILTFEPAPKERLNPKVKQHVINPGSIPVIGFIRAFFSVRKYIKKIKPNIIHAHSVSAAGIYAGLNKWLGEPVPYVVAAWGFSHIKAHKGIKRRLNKLCLNQASIITTTSSDLKNALVEHLQADESKFRVFSWGIDLNIFKINYDEEINDISKELSIDKNAPIIISPRNMSPYYRIHNIIKAIPKVLEDHPDSVFIFLRGWGTEEYERNLKDEVKSLGVEENVRFINKLLTLEEMAVFYNLSNIMVSISITDQLPAVLIEAMACNTFPILSNTTGCKAWVTHEKNGLYIDGDNVDELSKSINYAIENPDFLKDTFEYNKAFIKKYEDWEINSKKMEAIYNDIISRNL